MNNLPAVPLTSFSLETNISNESKYVKMNNLITCHLHNTFDIPMFEDQLSY